LNPDIVRLAAERIQQSQSTATLRKESSTSLVTLLGVLATVLVSIIPAIPPEWSLAAAIATGLASAINYYISRFTVPALTDGQKHQLETEARHVETLAQEAAGFPVYDQPSTADGGSTVVPTE